MSRSISATVAPETRSSSELRLSDSACDAAIGSPVSPGRRVETSRRMNSRISPSNSLEAWRSTSPRRLMAVILVLPFRLHEAPAPCIPRKGSIAACESGASRTPPWLSRGANAANLARNTTRLVVRFQHSHPFSAGISANAGIKGPLVSRFRRLYRFAASAFASVGIDGH